MSAGTYASYPSAGWSIDSHGRSGPVVTAKHAAVALEVRQRLVGTGFAAADGVPMFAESELPSDELGSWHGVFAPAGASNPIIAELNAEMVRGIPAADSRQRSHLFGVDTVGNAFETFAAFVCAEVRKWARE